MSTATVSQPVSQSARSASLPVRLITRWHLLSLDAPAVAVAWLLLLNRDAPRQELFCEAVALAAAVWTIYVLDRLMDAARSREHLRERHRFHHRHRRAFLAGLFAAAAVLVVFVPHLPAGVRNIWCLLALPLAMYSVLVHLLASRFRKEIVVGIFFAVAVTTPSWTGRAWTHVVPEAIMFCLLCCWNCFAINFWEGQFGTARVSSVLSALPFLLAASLLLCLREGTAASVLIAGAGSAGLLLLTNANRRRLDPLLLRSLADMALLTPLLVLPFLHSR